VGWGVIIRSMLFNYENKWHEGTQRRLKGSQRKTSVTWNSHLGELDLAVRLEPDRKDFEFCVSITPKPHSPV
jgi:hypothetical protein